MTSNFCDMLIMCLYGQKNIVELDLQSIGTSLELQGQLIQAQIQ